MSVSIAELTIAEAARKLRAGEITACTLADATLEAIAAHEEDVHAFLEVYDDVRAQAEEADARIAAGDAPVLTGIPIAVKDNILIKDRKVSAASKMLEGYVAPYDATAIAKLKETGAIFVGRTNMDEFAMGGSTENSAFGSTRNPHDRSRVAGGSSGGSAAAVAAGEVIAALGSDTGGSVRQPASYCGVVGLKPTYGSISRHGLIAMGSSLDVIGPLTRTVEDAELLFSIMRGRDPLDSTSIAPETYAPKETAARMKIGVPRAFCSEGVDAGVRARFEATLEMLAQKGHEIVDIALPNIAYSLPAYYIVMPAEVSSNLARFDGVKYGLHVDGGSRAEDVKATRGAGFGPEVRRRILLGTYVLSAGYYDAYYGKATAVRELIRSDFSAAFAQVDAIATPTTPRPAFRSGEKSDPVSMYLEDIFTVSANLTGAPAISVPMGTVAQDGKELPVGFQLIAPHGAEKLLCTIGRAVTGE